jgi:hypothetical protein
MFKAKQEMSQKLNIGHSKFILNTGHLLHTYMYMHSYVETNTSILMEYGHFIRDEDYQYHIYTLHVNPTEYFTIRWVSS